LRFLRSTWKIVPKGLAVSSYKYTTEEPAPRTAKLRDQMHAIIDRGRHPEGYGADRERESGE